MMTLQDIKIFSVISTFTDLGMEVFHDPQIPNLTYHDLLNIANYYSVILNIGESSGGLYGPLPVAYRTDFLLYLYTFELKNFSVEDERAQRNGNVVPAFLLIFFPTVADILATRSRDKITKEITRWKLQFSSIEDILKEDLAKLNLLISSIMINEQSIFEMSEIEEANVVIGKSIELLHNVSKYKDNPINLLVVGSDKIICSMTKRAIFEKNSSLIKYFKEENGLIETTLENINIKIVRTKNETESIQKYLNNSLNGVLYFGNFSSPDYSLNATKELSKLLKNTSQECAITFAISQRTTPTDVKNTKIPEVLKEFFGRSISLIDLALPKMTISLSLIEFLEKITENLRI